MPTTSPNFGFLAVHDDLLVRYAARAERNVFDDPNVALVSLRQFAESLAELAAAHHGISLDGTDTQLGVLHALADRGAIDGPIRSWFHDLRKAGNDATHNHLDDPRAALHALKMARSLAVWFHRAYGPDRSFSPGAFVPPPKPVDASDALRSELERMQAELAEARREIDSAIESAQAAEQRRRAAEQEAAQAWEEARASFELAEETEAALAAQRAHFEAERRRIEDQVQSSSSAEQRAVDQRASVAATEIDLDEADTRLLIDAQLRRAGWAADSAALRYAAGVRPQKGRNVAIAEWPTPSGPADYVLFAGLTPIAVVEAKRAGLDVAGAIPQAERYARAIEPQEGIELAGEWDGFRVPFVFATNGRPYLEQLRDRSGVHFRDLRSPYEPARALPDWYTPEDLVAELDKPSESATRRDIDDQFGGVLRRYQREAVEAVEAAIDGGRRTMLLAMATGTGKTRTAICLAYRLVQSRRFRRVLFLVDRSALGEQAAGAFSDLRLEQNQTFTDIYDVKGLDDKQPAPETRLHISTVQSMVRRILNPAEDDALVPVSWYDCVIIDECHRGYNLDRELSEVELTFRDEADYVSKYRRVVEHFDAVRIGLTATPALHTREIFGPPVFQYGYRRAVQEGVLCDYLPPTRITTRLSRDGIHWDAGAEVRVYQPRTGQLDLFETPDELDFDVADFNRSVLTENFNRAVCGELARHIDPRLAGKTLVFCVDDAHADLVVRLLIEAFQQRYGKDEVPAATVRKITGSVDRPLEWIRRYKNEQLPRVAVTVDLLTTGIDVPQICNLVFLRRVRSRILYEQMLGRATRRCDAIGKEVFRIYDAVDLYATLESYTDMTPVVTDPKVTIEQLAAELVALVAQGPTPHYEAATSGVRAQLAAKLQRKRRVLEDPDRRADFAVLAGGTAPEDFVALVLDGEVEDLAAMLRDHPRLAPWLDKQRSGVPSPVYVSDELDEVVEVAQGFGAHKDPGDFLEAFRAWLDSHRNELPALIAVTQRPRELTRAELTALRLQLDEAGFRERELHEAYRATTNQDIAAGIVGYIRRAALGDPLVPYEERVKRALSGVLGRHDWTAAQRQWLERIGKQLVKETVVDRAALDSDQFRAEGGGFDRLNKVFDGRLEAVLDELIDGVWESGGVWGEPA